MLGYDRIAVGVVLQGTVYVHPSLAIPLLEEHYPGVSVEVSGVERLPFHRPAAHLLGLVEVFAAQTEVVGVVVQATDVVILPLQTRVIGVEGLPVAPFAEENVAHDGVEVGHKVRIALVCYHAYAVLECVKSLVFVITAVVSHALEVIKGHFIGVVLTRRAA